MNDKLRPGFALNHYLRGVAQNTSLRYSRLQVRATSFRHLFALVLCLAVMGGSRLVAQAADAGSTNAVVNAEDTNASPAISTNQADQTEEEFQPGPGGVEKEAIVSFSDVVLRSNDVARTVVVIGANATIDGNVREVVVVIGGDLKVSGHIRHEAVTVFGSIKALKSAIFGDEVVAVGGHVESDDGVRFRRSPTEIPGPPGLVTGLRGWVFQCLFKLRPLAPQVGFVWVIWAAFFLIYFLVALILPAPVTACVTEYTRRPATTFFMGLLAKIVIPLVMGILIATGIGAIVVPFILAAIIFGAIVGKVALFEFLGGALGRRFGTTVLQNSLISFLIGVLIITLIYMIPVLGLIALGVVSVWGIGGAVTAAIWGLKRERPEKKESPLPPPASPGGAPMTNPFPSPTMAAMATATAAGFPSAGAAAEPFSASNPGSGTPTAASIPQAIPAPQPPGNVPEAYAYPRAGFWERMAAGFLDWVIVGFLSGFIGALTHKPGFAFLVGLIYFAGMWTWKGTTVGGVVLGLKVVRQDGYPVTLLVSIVRSLAAAFSIVMFFLGFLWIIFDRERQGWHDKIAGTVVIKLPKGTPLVLV